VLVVGPGADDPVTWRALVRLADKLDLPVWQASAASQAGFPGDHPRFQGHLPQLRDALRKTLAGHDVVLIVGAPAFRQGTFRPGPFVEHGTAVLVVTDDPDEAHRAAAGLALLASPAAVCRALAGRLPRRQSSPPERWFAEPLPPAAPLRAGHVLDALQQRLPRNAIVVEETPSSRPELHRRLRAVEPLGFLSAAMGGLGFALPAATGLRLARPDRPVVAVVGDGSALYSIQALWSAVEYRVGAVFVVLDNGGYAVMDRLAEKHPGGVPWPRVSHLDLGALAAGFGCASRRVETHDELGAALDDALAERDEPLLLDVVVAQDPEFSP
jgi:benzoylformate decarboxylase